MSLTRSLALSVALLHAPSVLFAATAEELLKRAEVADKHVSYRGLKTASVRVGNSSTTATIKIVHLKPDKTRTQYFAPPLLAGVILVQDGPELWRFQPQEDAWELVRYCRLMPRDTINQRALENYEVTLVGTDRVAGRETYVIHATPKRRGESARRIWVDHEHYLVMGTQVETPGGGVLNSSRYTSVEFEPGDISPSLFSINGKKKTDAGAGHLPAFRAAKPSYLPKGYRLIGLSRVAVDGCCSSHLQYSNGVNTISLFQRRAGDDSSSEQLRSKVTNVLSWVRAGMRFTLIGDLPRAELQRIADSVK